MTRIYWTFLASFVEYLSEKIVKNKTGVLTFNAVKVLNALAEKVVRNPGVNSFKGLGDTFYS